VSETPRYLVVSDFDGTITLDDLTNIIWDAHVPYDWRKILTPLSREGMLSPLEMIARGYADVRVPPETLLAEVTPRARFRAGFEDFVADCGRRGWPFEVLSHGLTFYLRKLLPPDVALTAFVGRFLQNSDGARWETDLPPGLVLPPGKDFKAHVVSRLHERYPEHTTVYVGDGRLDFPAARTCARIFAVRDSTLAHLCDEHGYAYEPFVDFAEITATLTKTI
jgi:2-hydroxy-3-keto-5-methylthiopentenyl-1-phosphate phosphatase